MYSTSDRLLGRQGTGELDAYYLFVWLAFPYQAHAQQNVLQSLVLRLTHHRVGGPGILGLAPGHGLSISLRLV